VYSAGTAENWKGAVALAVKPFLPATPLECPVAVELVFYLPRPKRLMRRADPEGAIPCAAKPDVDNAFKGTADSLTTVGLWRDDSQVWRTVIEKFYHAKGGKPGCRLVVHW
jgi:Holliday junction resolvase RusA-like endonuclease